MAENMSNVEGWPQAVWDGLEAFRNESKSGCGGCRHAGFFTSHEAKAFLPEKPSGQNSAFDDPKIYGLFEARCARNVHLEKGLAKTYCTWREEGPPALPDDDDDGGSQMIKAQARYTP